MKYFSCLPACREHNQRQRNMNMQMRYFTLKIFLLKSQLVQVNILGERGSDEEKASAFLHLIFLKTKAF